MEDLTTAAAAPFEAEQLADLATLGLRWDGPVVRQSDRAAAYRDALAELDRRGLTYGCTCSRREVREAAAAPHGELPEGAYPGTCLRLSPAERRRREREGRRPAIRLRAGGARVEAVDRRLGTFGAIVDDLVLARADGVAAYHLAVVVDDAAAGVTQVVRGDDLWSSTPRQVLLQQLLGLPAVEYLHVPLVLGPDGSRLSKRHGAVTLADRLRVGATPEGVLGWFAESLGWAGPATELDAAGLLEVFDPDALPSGPTIWGAPRRMETTD